MLKWHVALSSENLLNFLRNIEVDLLVDALMASGFAFQQILCDSTLKSVCHPGVGLQWTLPSQDEGWPGSACGYLEGLVAEKEHTGDGLEKVLKLCVFRCP